MEQQSYGLTGFKRISLHVDPHGTCRLDELQATCENHLEADLLMPRIALPEATTKQLLLIAAV